jgi:hypothetical protein
MSKFVDVLGVLVGAVDDLLLEPTSLDAVVTVFLYIH